MSLILAVIIGLVVGFLINYFSDVLPVFRRITRPLCGVCKQPYSVKDYLISFKCSTCENRASARTIIVLLAAVICCVLLLSFPFSDFGFWGALPILVFLGVIMVIDIEHRVVLFPTSIFGVILFLVYGMILRGVLWTLAGGLAGFFIMLSFYFLGIVFTKIVGKLRHREIDEIAFGFGDVCVGTFLGLLTGWPAIVGAIMIAFIAFTAFSFILLSVLILTGKYHAFSHAQPFTVFLILGAIAIFYL